MEILFKLNWFRHATARKNGRFLVINLSPSEKRENTKSFTFPLANCSIISHDIEMTCTKTQLKLSFGFEPRRKAKRWGEKVMQIFRRKTEHRSSFCSPHDTHYLIKRIPVTWYLSGAPYFYRFNSLRLRYFFHFSSFHFKFLHTR